VERLTPERRRERTRATLVEAAAEVFAEEGFERASLAAIADRAGFTRAAIYPYFATKRDLLVAAINEYVDRFLARYAAAVAERPPPLELAEAVRRWAESFEGDGETLNLLLLELRIHALRNPDARPAAAEVEARLEALVAARIAEVARVEAIPGWIPVEDLAALNEIVSVGVRIRATVLGIDPRPLYAQYLKLLRAGRTDPAAAR
jgi:AcrR family transcriptional regulator